MPLYDLKFLRCEVIRMHVARDKQWEIGDIVLWPGEIALPDWLKSLGKAADTPKSVKAASS